MLASFDTHLFWEVLRSGPYWKGALLAIGLTWPDGKWAATEGTEGGFTISDFPLLQGSVNF